MCYAVVLCVYMCVCVMRDNPSIRSKLSFPFDSLSGFPSFSLPFIAPLSFVINISLSLYFFSSSFIDRKATLDTIVHSTHHDSQLVSLHNIATVGIGGHKLGSCYRCRKFIV